VLPLLKVSDFLGCSRLLVEAMIALGQHCHDVTYVAANNNDFTSDYGILTLPQVCPGLKVLSVSGRVCVDSTLAAVALH
jgi:hypothetical protein